MEKVNYPSEEIINPSKQKPIEIPISTLSRHFTKLIFKGFIEKFARGHYRITPKGKKKFNDLSQIGKKERKLSYPPKIILKSGRNYSHWILWMVYNNNYCKRSDFLEDPLSINQSSLSKNLNLLVEKGFITKEGGIYNITRAGKSEYSRMLQNYDLDRQTILEEEGKRIEEITKKAIQFFERFNIKDRDIQFRFLTNNLMLDYEKVEQLAKDEEIFFKIVLFLSINHPDNYPNFISSEDFSTRYKIKKTTLDYFIDQISEGKIYPTRFFKLAGPSGGVYYFCTGGKLERMLQIITENQINKFTYLNKLFSRTNDKAPILDVNFIINQILEESCVILFDNNFKDSLRVFLPDYIIYLAYKIESKKELKNTYDKLEGIIWQDMARVFDSQISEDLKEQYGVEIKEIDNKLELNPKDIELYYSKMKILIYFNQYNDVLTLLDKMMEEFPEKEIDIMMKKASIFRKKKNLEAGLRIIEDLINKFPRNNDLLSYKAFWFQYLDSKEEAFEILQELMDSEPDKGIYHDNYGEILMYFEEYEEAVKRFLKALVLGNDDWYIYQTYIKLGICYKALGNQENLALALINLKKGKEIANKSSLDPDVKQKWLLIADLFLSEMEE
ncbi:MAG: hypothetical protein ACTSP9_04205 [Promethearchaeota archaeon]